MPFLKFFLMSDESFPCRSITHFPLSLGALSPYLQFIIPDFPLKSKKITLVAKKNAKTLGYIKNTPYLCIR